MRQRLRETIRAAVRAAHESGALVSTEAPAAMTVEVPRDTGHGDLASNAAMIMAKAEKKAPRAVAEVLMAHIQDPDGFIEGMEIAGPGFINFTLSETWWHHVVREVLRQGTGYGRGNVGRGRRVQVEFVSANPTGPLHVGHGRGAAIGDALARVLEASGYEVQREYYVNDAGRQMLTLGRSVLYRYYELFGREVDFASDLYQGDYIRDLGAELKADQGEAYLAMDEEEATRAIYPWAAKSIEDGIREHLETFGVAYDVWFSEKSLYHNGLLRDTLDDLRARGNIYDRDGAVWFASTRFGDDKDRVLVKSSGDHTYFASDIAYHRDKFNRGFDQVINLWGADHHGYVARMKSAVEAMGYGRDQLQVLLVQLVNLLRGGEPIAMSTRAGEFVTLKEVVDEVGTDAARFLFLTRSADSGLDFDLEVAKAQSRDNPVYYVQYAHARIASVFVTAAGEGLALPGPEDADLNFLKEDPELAIMKHLAAFPDVVEGAAVHLEPHRITHYLMDLAKRFHPYYNQHRFVGEDRELSRARLILAQAVKQVVANGLGMLGVSAPDKM